MFWNNLGYIILLAVATGLGFFLWNSVTDQRVKNYMKSADLSDKQRRLVAREAMENSISILARLVIWCAIGVGALLGNVIDLVLVIALTIEALYYIYREVYQTEKLQSAAMTFLAVPFGALIAIFGMKYLGLVWGIIIGLAIVVIVKVFGSATYRLSRKEE